MYIHVHYMKKAVMVRPDKPAIPGLVYMYILLYIVHLVVYTMYVSEKFLLCLLHVNVCVFACVVPTCTFYVTVEREW